LNVDTGNLFDDIVDSRHSEVDFFVMCLGEKDIKMMVRSKINIRMFITFEIKSQLHDTIISKSISIQGNTQVYEKFVEKYDFFLHLQ
jgi:ribosome-associated toxin RatA of RatAB toxin-antitoxin module